MKIIMLAFLLMYGKTYKPSYHTVGSFRGSNFS